MSEIATFKLLKIDPPVQMGGKGILTLKDLYLEWTKTLDRHCEKSGNFPIQSQGNTPFPKAFGIATVTGPPSCHCDLSRPLFNISSWQ